MVSICQAPLSTLHILTHLENKFVNMITCCKHVNLCSYSIHSFISSSLSAHECVYEYVCEWGCV